jgi:hypothetical protein
VDGPFFDCACRCVELCVEGFLETVVGVDGDGKVRKGGIAGACAPMYFVSVLLGYVAGVEFVALVASEFPDAVEVSPKYVGELLGPAGASVFCGLFAVTAVLFLVGDDGLCNLASEEVFPPDGLLMHGCAKERMGSWESLGDCRVMEPLHEALGDEFADWLSGVASVIEVGQSDTKEAALSGCGHRSRCALRSKTVLQCGQRCSSRTLFRWTS